MKKYIIPALHVADIENEVLMLDGSGTQDVPLGSDPITSGGGIGARDRDLFDWNDDEE